MKEELSDFIEAAGLQSYDPNEIKNIYKQNPGRLIKRLWQTLIPIALFFIAIGIEKIIGRFKDEKKTRERAKEFTNLLVKLGPAFIKAGQALSTRPDVVPQLVLEELSQLQDQLPGFDSELALKCIKEDLGKTHEEIYKYFEEEPISAASLGQVHQAILHTGEKVAVKIQRPGLREQITLDLYIVRNIAIWSKKYVWFIKSDLVGLIDELGRRVFEEMDYINEANNAEKFANLHKHNKNITVPKIYKAFTSKRILTMEWIEGVKLTKLENINKLGIDPNKMIEIGVNCSLQQLLEHGFFHADPHPGNILALEDGRLCYLDFGMMSEVSDEARTGLIQAVVHLVNRNFKKLSEDFVELGFLKENINLEPIVPAFEKVFESTLDKGVSTMDFKSVTDDMSGLMYRFPFQLPPYYALIIRSLITLEGIALSVDPEFKILGVAYPYFARRLMEDPDPKLRKSLKEMLFDENIFKWNRLEDLIRSATKQSEIDIEKLIDQVLDFLFSEHGGILREELIDSIAERFDLINLYAIKNINKLLPKNLQSNDIIYNDDINNMNELEPIKKLIHIIQNLPGINSYLIFKKINRLLKEPYARIMSIKIAKKVTNKSVARIIKLAAGDEQ
ncbi:MULTISPECIES: ABC1 kinase family protein [unclassified Prochlorococcus]|uniref:ABC1 kinase family protein n=1 Tax=unclassified Prochlorococcus TaxID=2627481 RepID=UPI000533B9D4|nr:MULTISPECIES: AarF/ABC1/UbiB kinase family protein [unclassified Prochlorococcus]KGG14499.1 Ubiquinone biosynthesis monooxygenase UbiB [Prochlorococcus sp. MIT 0602]KGG16076.1 Ubiquinone biosynthesis monooxygenase UbiB [Prochlorococcus sp. MIT 0603]